VSIDDILVYSKNEEEHVEHLAVVFRLVREHQLKSKLSECSLFQIEVHYLGHVVSKESIAVYPKRIKATMEWVSPKNLEEQRCSMGLAGYYKRFIRNSSHIYYPITSLKMKHEKLEWTEECEAIFEKLK